MPAKYLTVPMPFGGEEVGILFCPVCGRRVTSKRKCSHLLFIYLEEVGDFEWLAPSLRTVRKSMNLQRHENPTRAIARLVKSESAVCFYFTPNETGGGIGIGIEFAERD
jgi:hypothetical protein